MMYRRYKLIGRIRLRCRPCAATRPRCRSRLSRPTQLPAVALACGLAVVTASASAAPVYQPPGANLTYGDVTHGLRTLSAAGNPAAAAADAARTETAGEERNNGFVLSAVAGIEFGNVDELFNTLNSVTDDGKPDEPPPDPAPGQPIYKPGSGINLGDIVDICCPDLRAKVDRIKTEITNRVGLLLLIEAEAYAKTFESIDLPVLLGRDVAGGAWTFGLNRSLSSKSYAFADSTVAFDAEAAFARWTNQYDLAPDDPETYFDLGSDVGVFVDPRSGQVRAFLDNDSTIVTKAASTTELSVGYGRSWRAQGGTGLFVGGRLNYFDLKLSRNIVRYGDITDTEAIFESIRDADYIGDGGFGIDLGLLWVGDRAQIGASLRNINEPTFVYPDVNLSMYRDQTVIAQLIEDRTYQMKRQLKLEASLFSQDRRWSLNLGLDANDTTDPMGDLFQWLTMSSGWTTGNRWLQNVRLGYRKNLVGTELGYLSAGLTAFRWLNVDLATELDRVDIDGDTLPRGLILSLGVQFDF